MSRLSSFLKLIQLFWRHGAALAAYLPSLPQVMHAAGQGMELAGNGAVATSKVLRGGVGVPLNAKQVVAGAADAVEAAKAQLQAAADLVKEAGNTIGSIKVPTVTATYINLPIPVAPGDPPWRVVSGVSFGETSLFGGVKTALRDSSSRIDDVADDFQGMANNLNKLSQALNDAGADLGEMGGALRNAGQALQEITAP